MKKGDIVKVSYTGWYEDNLIETTDADVAKKEDVYDKERQYKPAIVVVGEGMVLAGLDRGLEEISEGEEKEFDLGPQDAFGERSFKNIQLVPINEFRKQNIKPFPGMVFDVEGRPAKIQSVSGGRVRVDFNHPLAGKDLHYKIKVESAAKTEDDKIKFLLERGFRSEDVKYTLSGAKEAKKLVVDVPEELKKDRLYQIMKAIFKVEAEKYLGIKDVGYEGEEIPEGKSKDGTSAKSANKKESTPKKTAEGK